MIETAQLSDAKRKLLSKYLEGKLEVRSTTDTLPLRAAHEPIPLSYAQEQVWLHAQMAPGLPLYNEPVTIHYSGMLDRAVLERSFNEILRRHEAWRTCFVTVDGAPLQKVEPSVTVSLPVIDLRHMPEDQRNAEAVRIATGDAKKPIDLTQAPLFQARLIQLGDQEYRLYLNLSHIIFDGVAIYQVFLPELSKLYEAFSAGKPSPLPEIRIQYPDFSSWQRRCMAPEALGQDIEYWKRELSGTFPELYLPVDRPHAGPQTFRGSMVPFRLDSALTAKLRAFCKQEGVSLFPVLFAGFAALLYRYSGEEVLPIGSVTAGRSRPETQSLLGYFLNTIVLRTDLSGDPSFRALVLRARNVIVRALKHDNLPFEYLVREVRIKRDPSRNPLFQALFSLEPPLPEVHPAWRLTQMDIDTGASKYDLYLELDERSDEILARFHYSTDLFDITTLERMAKHWQVLLEGAVGSPESHLSQLPVLAAEEKHQLLSEWNDTKLPFSQTCIHTLFERQVEQSPNAVAVVFENSQLTYHELNERANQLAHHLRECGVGPEMRVGLCMERGLELIIGLLAILKAGGAYVPLDPAFPQDRLAFMFSDAKPCLLLTQERLRQLLPEAKRVVIIGADWERIAASGKHNPEVEVAPENLAYVIYTSGSTGAPKGVQVEHRNVVNLLVSMQRETSANMDDVLVAVTTLSFDIAGLELYLPLISGSKLVIASAERARDGNLLLDLLKRNAATIMQATPTSWRLLIEAGWEGTPSLKVLCGGEALPPELGLELTVRSEDVWNVYGPTETTIWSSIYRLTGHEKQAIPIGKPIANTQIYVLDAQQHPVPVNVVGEIYIGGDGVARGYLNREEMTAARFVPDPFAKEPARLYRTGDRGRFRADGNIECLGRLDHQVKIRGFRVELGEIEAVLGRHAAVRRCVVVAHQDVTEKSLVAYLESQPGTALTAGDLRAHLNKRLPDYMLPSEFVVMRELPMTANGKIDRKALPVADEPRLEVSGQFVAPQDEIELVLCQLWSRILRVKRVGINDDFFELGGHSLAAVRMMSEVQKLTGRRLPLSTLFQAPTVNAVAELLRREKWTPSWSSLVPIQPLGSSNPLFLIHGAEGNVLLYQQLIRHLGPDQPVYGLQSQGLKGNEPLITNIPEMAARYLKEVMTVQPHGPYLFAGYCLGGLIALEMAHQVNKAGEKVELVVMLDSYNPTALRHSEFLLRAPQHFLQNLRFHASNFASIRSGERGRFLRTKLDIELTRLRIRLRTAYHSLQRARGRKIKNDYPHLTIKKVNDKAAVRYVPQPYNGRVAVIRPKGNFGGYDDPSLGWSDLVRGDLEVHELPVYPKGLLVEPFCRLLAERLKLCLKGQ